MLFWLTAEDRSEEIVFSWDEMSFAVFVAVSFIDM